MDRRQAKREVCSFMADLIQSTLDNDPFVDNESPKDAKLLRAAMEDLRQEMLRRSGRLLDP